MSHLAHLVRTYTYKLSGPYTLYVQVQPVYGAGMCLLFVPATMISCLLLPTKMLYQQCPVSLEQLSKVVETDKAYYLVSVCSVCMWSCMFSVCVYCHC